MFLRLMCLEGAKKLPKEGNNDPVSAPRVNRDSQFSPSFCTYLQFVLDKLFLRNVYYPSTSSSFVEVTASFVELVR